MASGRKYSFMQNWINHVFLNGNIANIGDSTGIRGSVSAGNLYIALYSVTPTENTAGTESSYTNYARVAVPRTNIGWITSGLSVVNKIAITFPQCGAVGDTLNGFAICKGGTVGVDDAIYYNDLNESRTVSLGGSPVFKVGSFTT